MQIYDISWPISEQMTTYKNRNDVDIKTLKEFSRDGVHESALTMHMHTGTHIDAPKHFIPDGVSIEHVPLTSLIGIARVIIVDPQSISQGVIDVVFLQQYLDHDPASVRGCIVLFKTSNSLLGPADSFNPHFVYLGHDAARLLVELEVRAVGLDYLGIERDDPKHRTHEILMRAGVSIIEGLRLKAVPAGEYTCICLPLLIPGVEAAPARCILISQNATAG